MRWSGLVYRAEIVVSSPSPSSCPTRPAHHLPYHLPQNPHAIHNNSINLTFKMETVENFTNDSSMMIAYERSLESQRPDALFQDPYAA
jgi:hypothetical protein